MAKRKRIAAEEGKKSTLGMFVTCVVCIFFLFPLILPLSSCSTAEEPATKPAKKVQVKKPRNKKPPPPEKALEKPSEEQAVAQEYSYDATGKIDPFVPLVVISTKKTRRDASAETTEKADTIKTPLQKFDLSELKLVAVIVSGEKSSAVVEDTSGYGYIVTSGMLIGKKDGVIKTITPNAIIVEEQTYNSRGILEKSIAKLTIQHQE